jgi:hypothetical protein
MTISIILLLILSAMFRSFDQIIRYNQQDQTWLPNWFWNWRIGNFKVLNADHVYMGVKMTLSWIGFLLLGALFISNGVPTFYQVLLFIAIWLAYYQVFNLFFHIILKLKIG